MKSNVKSWRWVALAASLSVIANGSVGRAQVSPVGGDHVSVGPGAGLVSPVSPTGAFQATVPLDLPSPRGGLPVPVRIQYTGTAHVGAAGAGWDLPLAHVRRSRTTWHRTPAINSNLAGEDHVPERLFVSLGGRTMYMVPSPQTGVWIPFLSDESMELRETAGGWVLATSTADHVFSPATSVGGGDLPDQDVWLLTEIRDRIGTDRVTLHYDTRDGTAGLPSDELDLVRVEYGHDGSGRSLYQIELAYAPPDPTSVRALGLVDTEAGALARSRVLQEVRVRARNNLATFSAPRTIRTYRFAYEPDADTALPRLVAVTQTGEEGTGTPSLPVATYRYGAATEGGTVRYGTPVEVWRRAEAEAAGATALARSVTSSHEVGEATREDVRSRHAIRDFTGDAVPDLVYKAGDRWHLHAGVVTDAGPRFDTGATASWTEPAEIFVQLTTRFDAGPAMATTETLVRYADWNGDGRLDIVHADGAGDERLWRVWINRPGGTAPVVWEPIDVDVTDFHEHIEAHGLGFNHDLFGDWGERRIAIERSRSWPRTYAFECTQEVRNVQTHVLRHEDCPGYPDEAPPGQMDTVVEWTIDDVNGDRLPDWVANTNDVEWCVTEDSGCSDWALYESDDSGLYESRFCSHTRREWLSTAGMCIPDGTPAPRNEAHVLLNHQGLLTSYAPAPRSYGATRLGAAELGITRWTTGVPQDGPMVEGIDLSQSWRAAGLVDRHANGVDRYEVAASISERDSFHDRFDSDRHEQCTPGAPSDRPFTSRQVTGTADLNGDGSPDLVREQPDGTWWVQFGGTAGYGPDRRIASPDSFPFAISETVGTCGGETRTTAGLLDLDGDGKPELVREVDGALLAAELVVDGVAGGLSAGRLVEIGNGYGATTVVAYANNKAEPYTTHAVPFPEIVVASVQTIVEDGSAPDGVPVRYAYGHAESRYDPATGRVAFMGYRRHVALTGEHTPRTGDVLVEGVAVVTDHRPPSAFSAGFAAYALGGRPEVTSRFEGTFHVDPRELLLVLPQDSRLRARATVEYAVHELAVAPPASELGALECGDLDPATGYAFWNDHLCQRAGIVYARSQVAWEGLEDPSFGDRNTLRGSSVTAIDERGRPVELALRGDLRSLADDRCVTIQYATPTSGASPVTSVVSGIWTTDCGWMDARLVWDGTAPAPQLVPGTPVLIAGVRFTYDGLPEGQYSLGRRTSRIVERYDTTDGSALGEHVAETLAYDALGNVHQVTASRTIGTAATRTTTFTYDPFGLSVTAVTEAATDVAASFRRETSASVWPSIPIVERGLNGESTTTYRDGFGRPIETSIDAPGVTHVASRLHYVDAVDGRRVTETVYPGDEWKGVARTVVLDALGRPRFAQEDLGADYGGRMLVSGLRDYDAWGRVRYEAAPFEWSGPFSPDALSPAAWPFGVTAVHDVGGRLVRVVEGPGLQLDATTSSVAGDVFVTTYEHTWTGGLAVTRALGATENDPASVTYGAWDEVRALATGTAVERARYAASGVRADLVRYEHDRLGHPTVIRRYASPSSAADDVVWRRRFDSLGQVLRLEEPGVAPVSHAYDELGGLVRTLWVDEGTKKITRRTYDGLGRLTREELARSTFGSGETVEWTQRLAYDAHSGNRIQPAGSFVGRLSMVEAIGIGKTYYAYDALGRTTSEAYELNDHPSAMRVGWSHLPGGALHELIFETTAGTERFQYDHDTAWRTRRISEPGGPTLFVADEVDLEGRYRDVRLGNGVVETFKYAPTGRESLLSWSASTATEPRWTSFDQRDAEGRVVVETFFEQGKALRLTNTFDELDRLTRQRTTAAPGYPTVPTVTEAFKYDAIGNLTLRHASDATSLQRQYTYDAVDRDRLCWFGPTTEAPGDCNVVYDASGAVRKDWTSGVTRYFSYDAGGRATSITNKTWTASFQYGPGGALVRTEVRKGLTLNRRILRFGDLIEERTRPDGAVQIERRIPGPLGIVAIKRTDATRDETVYVHGDPRGNRFFTRADGTIVESVRYRAFGGTLQNTGSPSSITYTDDLWNGGDDLSELGVVVLGARLYDPVLQRFLQRDPLLHAETANRGNPYSFAFNDPVNYSDPTGLYPGTCYGAECLFSSIGNDLALGLFLSTAVAQFQSGNHGSAPLPLEIDTYITESVADLVQHWGATDHLYGPGPTEGRWDLGPSDAVNSIALGIYDIGRDLVDTAWQNAKCNGLGMAICGYLRAQDAYETIKGLEQFARDPIRAICAAGNGDCLRGATRIFLPIVVGMVVPGAGMPRARNGAAGATRGGASANGVLRGGAAEEIRVPSRLYPETAAHIKDAQRAGYPSELTIDRPGAPGRRAESLAGQERLPGMDLDEYPPAMFREGGRGSSVRPVTARDNRGAGACIGNQCRGLPDGTRVRIVVE